MAKKTSKTSGSKSGQAPASKSGSKPAAKPDKDAGGKGVGGPAATPGAASPKGQSQRNSPAARRGKLAQSQAGGSKPVRQRASTARNERPLRSSGSRSGSPSAPGQADVATPQESEPPIPRTRLSAKQLEVFRELLLAKRRELLGDVRHLADDILGRSRQDAAGDLSNMPIHMADLGSDNWEQEFTLGLIANEQQLVREIDEALARIEDQTYGVCLATHNPINLTRLRAKPWAKYCIEYARQHERGPS